MTIFVYLDQNAVDQEKQAPYRVSQGSIIRPFLWNLAFNINPWLTNEVPKGTLEENPYKSMTDVAISMKIGTMEFLGLLNPNRCSNCKNLNGGSNMANLRYSHRTNNAKIV